MVTAWSDVIGGAVATILIVLALLQLPTARKKLGRIDALWLAGAGGAGVLVWNIILNSFSLAGLDIDAPLIRVSIADLASGLMAALFTWLYIHFIQPEIKERSFVQKPASTSDMARNATNFEFWPYLLPALVAFIIDLFFI